MICNVTEVILLLSINLSDLVPLFAFLLFDTPSRVRKINEFQNVDPDLSVSGLRHVKSRQSVINESNL